MKHYLALALAAFALILVAPGASAVRIRVVDAPPVDCTALTDISPNTACSITDLSDIYKMSFVDASLPGCQSATSVPDADIDSFNWCIIFNNLSGDFLTSLNFTFTVPTQGDNDDYSFVFCDAVPSSVSSTFCPEGPVQAGDIITATFSADPGVPTGEDAYLFVDFENNPGDVNATFASTSVPEPGELGLFGLGLLAIGVGYGWEKRRQSRRIHTAG
jgi:hypothetical protein